MLHISCVELTAQKSWLEMTDQLFSVCSARSIAFANADRPTVRIVCGLPKGMENGLSTHKFLVELTIALY